MNGHINKTKLYSSKDLKYQCNSLRERNVVHHYELINKALHTEHYELTDYKYIYKVKFKMA